MIPKPKSPSPQRAARRQRIAAAVVADSRVTEIARSEGISRQQASQEVHSPQTQQYILHLMERHYTQVEKTFVKALGCIR